MKKTRHAFLSAIGLYLALAVFAPGQSFAHLNINPPATAPQDIVFVGEVNGGTVVIWSNAIRTQCQITVLSTPSQGGMRDNATVVTGAGNNTAYFVNSTKTEFFCNQSFTMSPVRFNGFYIDLWGSSGNDRIGSSTTSSISWLDAGSGSDTIWVKASNQFGEGGNDGDVIYSEGHYSSLSGGGGDDLFCLGFNVLDVAGGNGTDVICGAAVINVPSSVEYPNNNQCSCPFVPSPG